MAEPDKEVKGLKEVKKLALYTSFTLFTSFVLAQQAPVFRSRIEVVQLDVSVLDKHRQPIKGLTEKDFTILEDGKPQKIVGFAPFDMDDAPPPATGWMRDVPPDVTTNDLKPESRLFVIVMDDAMIPQDPFAIQSAKKIANEIIETLQPTDVAAVVFTGDNRKTQDFTSDKTKLKAALDKFNPGLAGYRFGSDSPPPPVNKAMVAPRPVDTDLWFYQSSVRTLQNIAEYLAAVPNRRKAVFWVSPGVPMDMGGAVPDDKYLTNPICLNASSRAACEALGPEAVWGPNFPPGEMRDLQRQTDAIFLQAQRANVTIYPIDPMGLDGMRGYLVSHLGTDRAGFARWKATAQMDYLVAAAANTGGRAIVNINEFAPELHEIFDENKSYYLLAFEPANPASDGKLHKLTVKVARPDVEVRTRSGYYDPQPNKAEDKRVAKAGMTPDAVALAKSMAGILPTAGMPMRAVAAPFAVPGQRLSTVTVVLGVRQPIPETASKDRVTETTELLTTAFTPEGDQRGAQRHTAKVVLRAGSNGEAAYEVLAKIDPPAGRYQLRLAAHNAVAGKDGSVFVDVVVPDYSNVPFSASPVVMSASPGRVSAPKDLFSPLLPLVPTAEREFATADKVTAFMRLYQSGQKPIERANLSIKIRDAQNQVKADESRVIAVDQFIAAGQDLAAAATPQPTTGVLVVRPPRGLEPSPTPTAADKFANLSLRTADIKYAIPFAKLSPGPHLLTFEATLGMTTIRRDVRFEVK